MYIGVKSVKPLNEYKLLLTFKNNEERIFDMNEYLNKGIFTELKNIKMFRTVHVSFDSVEWANGADLDPEILYNESSRN
jgi:hypothetical protein